MARCLARTLTEKEGEMQINSEGKSIDKWKLHLKLGTEKRLKDGETLKGKALKKWKANML
jgi:hypothetical protein